MGYIREASVGLLKTLFVRNVIDYNNDAEIPQTVSQEFQTESQKIGP